MDPQNIALYTDLFDLSTETATTGCIVDQPSPSPCNNASLNFETMVTAFAGFNSIGATVSQLTDCLYVINIFQSVVDVMCGPTDSWLDVMTWAGGIIGIAYFALLVAAILGMKRFSDCSAGREITVTEKEAQNTSADASLKSDGNSAEEPPKVEPKSASQEERSSTSYIPIIDSPRPRGSADSEAEEVRFAKPATEGIDPQIEKAPQSPTDDQGCQDAL